MARAHTDTGQQPYGLQHVPEREHPGPAGQVHGGSYSIQSKHGQRRIKQTHQPISEKFVFSFLSKLKGSARKFFSHSSAIANLFRGSSTSFPISFHYSFSFFSSSSSSRRGLFIPEELADLQQLLWRLAQDGGVMAPSPPVPQYRSPLGLDLHAVFITFCLDHGLQYLLYTYLEHYRCVRTLVAQLPITRHCCNMKSVCVLFFFVCFF